MLAGLTATLRFSPAAFFYGLLPPIVFAAGFTLKACVRTPRGDMSYNICSTS